MEVSKEVSQTAGGGPSELRIIASNIRAQLLKNYLPIAFFVANAIALAWPLPGQKVANPEVHGVHVVVFINICIVFFISGLTLRTDELKDAFTRRTAAGTVFGFVSIVGLTPLLAWAVRDLPLQPPGFSSGLVIFCIVPTTLGVGVSLVTSAKGNVALAIFLTVSTNVLGVVLVPLWLKAVLSGDSAGVEGLSINFLDIFVKLLISFFVPTVIGKALRELCPPVLRFVRAHKVMLSLISNTNLAIIIWQTISSGRDVIVNTSFGNMAVIIVSTVIIHFIYLIFNTAVVALLRLPLPEAIATTIMASQKSAPVAVTVISYIASTSEQQGVLSVPAVLGQLTQIFIGQPIAHYLASRMSRWQAARAAEEEAAKDAAENDAATC